MKVTEDRKEKCRKLPKGACCQRDSAEHEEYGRGHTVERITENNNTNANRNEYVMLEEILCEKNLNQAYKQVKKNKGAGGIDEMGVDELLTYLKENGGELRQSILDGKYRPNPVRRVEIPKDNGKKRMLGIPTVVDRVIQQAIAQVLISIYEKQFSETSYGFRPKRSAHDAIKKCQENINDGYKYVVDMDLEKFFDTVNQSKMIEILGRTIKDGRVISLINKFLNAGVVISGKYENTKVGVPQGGPLSPLLSNIMLNELDKELERRGLRFVRYADDDMIFCKSKRSAKRVLENIIPYIEKKLYLKVNKEKTVVAYVGKVKFLGYGFYITKHGARMRVSKQSVKKMKAKIKELTSRSNGWGNEQRKREIKLFITGWLNYYKLADMKNLLKEIDQWMRRRIRMVIWKQWKKIRTKGKMLIKLGVKENQAWQWANTRKNYWRIARSPILSTAVDIARIRQSGYLMFSDYYNSVKA